MIPIYSETQMSDLANERGIKMGKPWGYEVRECETCGTPLSEEEGEHYYGLCTECFKLDEKEVELVRHPDDTEGI